MHRPTLVPLAPSQPGVPPALTATLDSFDLSLRVAHRSDNTRAIYLGAARKLAAWLHTEGVADFLDVKKAHLELYLLWLSQTPMKNGKLPATGYVNNQYRALQQLFKWLADEEEIADPFKKMKPPKIDRKLKPILDEDVLTELIKSCEKRRDFESRRDAAIMRLFASTGIRLAELTYLTIGDLDLIKLTGLVMGKGRKQRLVKFDAKTAQALSRYLRVRTEHKFAAHPRLWLAIKNRGPMTPNGIRQIIERRGAALGLDIHPHMFRHTFSHRWLDAGGAEGDLMELNGWDSPAMVRHYGRSAAGVRARRAYDRVNVMGDI